MYKNQLFLLFLGLAFLFSNCNKLIFRDVSCRPFEFTEEQYWYSENVDEQITFVSDEGDTIRYTIEDKGVQHRTNYISDTGCGCFDFSKMLLTNNNDSIYFLIQSRYVEDNQANQTEDVVFVFNNQQSVFYETSKAYLNEFTIDTTVLEDVKLYEISNQSAGRVEKAYFAKDIGLVQFEKTDGTIWTNINLSVANPIDLESFDYTEDFCE